VVAAIQSAMIEQLGLKLGSATRNGSRILL
jgi:hypothetical protein